MAILRRIKEKLIEIMKRQGKAKKSKALPGKIKRDAFRAAAEKKEVMGQQETAIGKTKFYTAEAPTMPRVTPQELPGGYGQDKIVLQVRDPRWLHSYWEVSGLTYDRLKREFKDDFCRARRILRVYDVSQIIFDGNNAHSFFDIQINEYTNNWYIDTAGPGKSWCADLGLLLPDGRFIMIVRSNTVSTPIEGPSWITDEEWMIPDDMFARLYGMGFGLGRSSPVGKAWQERVKRELFSGVLSSGVSSLASPVKKVSEERKFWLVVNTELIVYGATEPDAKVYMQDKQVNLRPDGTFSMRFALPNGKQVIPVKAVAPDNKEERTITPVVTKETR
ncbi:MAG: DUF4912 domain-containing protein [Candidatus Omnitrophota bacterium]